MRKKKAIVFDDEESILSMLERVLSRMDYELLMFSEPVICPIYGDEEQICRASRPCSDIMIADYKLPRMTGLDLFLEQVRRGCKLDPRNRAVISGFMPETELGKIHEIGAAFFSKPFQIGALMEWIKTCEERIDLSQPLAMRRKEDRRPVEIPIYFMFSPSGKVCQGTVTEISDSGFRMRVSAPLEKKQMITVTSRLPNSCMTASVCWVATTAGGQYTAGFHRV